MLSILFLQEYDARTGTDCECGRTDAGPRVWRCIDCTDNAVCCASCLKERHQRTPFHKVQRWNGQFFARQALCDVGVTVHLGHDGDRCPKVAEQDAVSMSIGDVTEIHAARVYRCNCAATGEDPTPLWEQLLLARLFPATFSESSTRSAYTFRLMEHWHLDIMQGKKLVYDYWLSLQRRTNVVANDLSGYKNFLRAGRYWRDLTSRRQSGQGHGIDAFLPANRYPGSVAIVCPACPE
ncbi:hypothetical protein EXIGLDRAFT_606932 [Exidia glandulosa HHB12029]|uniref:CxC2-like cysteine cluster KDZ transposase-associated domain-containing protein n=1 Tax=Exidia glandulosa HHB12029 TaxID=1314781 RepID=A0A165LXV0_EXIGL|nr:hypothetical protein EXIGLDRAFT_606932 [Exidia glandulosa HHB12029]